MEQIEGRRVIAVSAALIIRENSEGQKEFMICQRPPYKARGLLWEFVGGKVEYGEGGEALESGEEALVRECREELGVTVRVGKVYTSVLHDYPDILIRLTLYRAEIVAGAPQLLEHTAIAWISPSEIGNYDFCPADTDILVKIQKEGL